ncbi:MAG: hypothetical protein WCR51_11205 [Planctomycetia bacterium]
MLAHGPTAAAKPAESLERALVVAAGALAVVLVVSCGVVLVVRRLGGGFEPVGGAASLIVAALGGLLVLACDAATRGAGLAPSWRHAARAGYLLALVAVALPFRGASGLDTTLFIAGAGLAGAVVVGPFVRRAPRRWLADRLTHGARPGVVRSTRPPTAQPTSTLRADAACPGHLLQRFERYELDGVDCLRGILTLEVPEGSRTAYGHVGFCPSFRQVPQVEASTSYDGVEAIVTAAEIVPWGVRIECRLDEPTDEPIEIPVDVIARAPA